MYLLYADESGIAADPKQSYFVLAGISVFERQSYWFADELNKIAARFNVADPGSVELHGSPMLTGKNMWRRIPPVDREKAFTDALAMIANSHQSNRLFASVIKKSSVSPDDPVDLAFEQLAMRFDNYLKRLHKAGDIQRGLIVFDKSTYETTIQTLATEFRTTGHSWGLIHNFAEVPLFLDSKASPLIQLADLVAYALFRHFESGDSQYYEIIKKRFDTVGGIVHGLHEIH